MAKKVKINKTLVEQILSKANIPHQGIQINALEGELPQGYERDQIFKTLALLGDKTGPIIGIVPITKHLRLVKELLDETLATYPIDPKRVYIMGISMGAIATLDMVYRFPDTFAKAVSICGATNIERMREFKGKTQFRFYHGDIDDVIPVTYSREAYKALKTTGKKAEYIEFYGANHNAWHPAFNTPDFLQWTFKKK